MGRTSSQVKQRYNEKAYDEIKVRVPKGQREEIKAYCERRNESVNGFFLRAMKETMERDSPSEARSGPVSAFINRAVEETGGRGKSPQSAK